MSTEIDVESTKGAGKKLFDASKNHFAKMDESKKKETKELASFSSPLETLLGIN